MSDPQKATINEVIRTYSPLIITLAMAAVTWGMFTSRLTANEGRTAVLEVKSSNIDTTLTQLLVAQASMASDIKFLTKRYK